MEAGGGDGGVGSAGGGEDGVLVSCFSFVCVFAAYSCISVPDRSLLVQTHLYPLRPCRLGVVDWSYCCLIEFTVPLVAMFTGRSQLI